ncbi:MAG: endo-1,4-beta-xylanase [Prevotella sp.]|nr:endo-1,4-beta-xylanase [Prevotella sp.]
MDTMKKTIIISALGAMFMASCADEFNTNNYVVDRPAKTAEYAYLNDYQPLKQYVDRAKSPNFKLGVGTTATEYLKQELVYALVNSNFDETEPGNAMKMASCVDANTGAMNFGTVTDYVNMATEAGLSVYGHTLAWHAQQPVKWLNSLMKDKELDIDPDAKIEEEVYKMDWTTAGSYSMWGQFPEAINAKATASSDGLTVTTTGTIPNFWELQFMVADGISLEEGAEYVMRLEIQGSPANDNLHYVIGAWGNDVKTGVIDFNDNMETRDIKFTTTAAVTSVHMLLQSGDYAGSYTIKSVALYKLESPAVEVEQEVNFYTYETKPDGAFPHFPMGCEPPIVNGALHFVPTGAWSQFFVVPGGDNKLDEGDYVFYVDMAADKEASGVQLTVQNGWGGDAQNFTQAVPVVAGRHTYTLKFPGLTGSPDPTYDVILKPQTADAVLDFYSLKVCKVVKLNSIPLTPEEKKDTLTWAMDRWVKGMMEACDGKVKAWDVVNEAISGGGDDGEGNYALQHGSEGNTTDFFWQDYLGDIDYVRTAVRLAREYGPEDVKLFINDYNLESDWDQNKKLKSLINWIKKWEADGITKIDGIGTQMHISCYANASTQESKKAAIVNMFKLMAATGKLVRVSELDMGYVGADGNSVLTANITEEQHKQMADLYKFVVNAYLENVPAAQQWGICQWCITDSPTDSGWRKGEPTGLWDKDYYRKHTYAGFADGLSSR